MTKFSKKFKVSIIVLAILLLAAGCSPSAAPAQNQPATQNSDQTQAQTEPREFSYNGLEGQDALSLLKLAYAVETKDFGSLGEMVVGINGVKPAKDEFWAFYVNGQSSNVGASSYITKNDDKIEWKLEKINQ